MLCTFDDLPVTRRYSHLTTVINAPYRGAASLAEAEAMRHTLSWRVTAPLRDARRRFDPLITRAQAVKRALKG